MSPPRTRVIESNREIRRTVHDVWTWGFFYNVRLCRADPVVKFLRQRNEVVFVLRCRFFISLFFVYFPPGSSAGRGEIPGNQITRADPFPAQRVSLRVKIARYIRLRTSALVVSANSGCRGVPAQLYVYLNLFSLAPASVDPTTHRSVSFCPR